MSLLAGFLLISFLVFYNVQGRNFPTTPTTNCKNACGNVSVEYPFGIGPGCSIDEAHELSCENSSILKFAHIPGVAKVLQITETSVTVVMRHNITCYDEFKAVKHGMIQELKQFDHSIFQISATENKLVFVGCNLNGYFLNPDMEGYSHGCTSICNKETDITLSDCKGDGCCLSTIPSGVNHYALQISSINSFSRNISSLCPGGFIVDKRFKQYNKLTLTDRDKLSTEIPIVLDWVAQNSPCAEAESSSNTSCSGDFSTCVDASNGHRCACKDGFQGNPYLPRGCKAVNKCKKTSCHNNARCAQNIDARIKCRCSTFYVGDGTLEGTGCTFIFAGTARVIATLILLGIGFISGINYPRAKQFYRKRHNFRKNGGLLLEKKIKVLDKGITEAYVISIEEVEKMTHNFNADLIIGKGGFGTVYLGMLSNGEQCAVKVTKTIDQDQVNQFINELFILLQIRHKSIIRVVACCLQREDPIIAYQYITNGTVYEHLHKYEKSGINCWKTRIHILVEVASAITYLHFEMEHYVLHKDIKAANVLLDKDYNPKLCDFGLATLTYQEHTDDSIEEDIMGTHGYIEPDLYEADAHYVKESDVYSFGILLLELMTGKHAHVISSNLGQLEEPVNAILDKRVSFNPKDVLLLKGVVDIGKRCIKKREERPNIRDVAVQLREILNELVCGHACCACLTH